MNNTFLLAGTARCGSSSLWDFLSQHPNIHATRKKEVLCNLYRLKELTVENYLDQWDWSKIKDGDIIFDGTTSWWKGDNLNNYKFDEIFGGIKPQRLCCIYTIRNPYIDMWRSRILMHLKADIQEIGYAHFVKDLKLNYKAIQRLVSRGLYKGLKRIEPILGKENIFTIHVKELEKLQKEIFNFLKIDNSLTFKSVINLNPQPEEVNIHPLVLEIDRYLEDMKMVIEYHEKRDTEEINNWRKKHEKY